MLVKLVELVSTIHLQSGVVFLFFLWRINLFRGQKQILLEIQSHDLILLPAISEAADDLSEDLPISYVIIIDQDNALCRDQICQ